MFDYSKIIAYFTLSVWIFYIFIHTAIALLQLSIHHQTIQRKVSHKNPKHIKQLVISTQDKNFIRINQKEFIWQNEWYDIVSISQSDGLLYLTAYLDKKEHKLRKNLSETIQNSQEKSEKSKINPKFEGKEYCINGIIYSFITFSSSYSYYSFEYKIQDLSLPLISPPPKFFC